LNHHPRSTLLVPFVIAGLAIGFAGWGAASGRDLPPSNSSGGSVTGRRVAPALPGVPVREGGEESLPGSAGASDTSASNPGTRQTEKRPEGAEESKHEGPYKLINFVLLALGLGYLVRKPLSAFLAQRSEAIREGLEEARKALEASQARLKAVEEKLERLEEEIAGFKAAAASEMEAERERLRQATAEQAARIMQAARMQIESATRAAKFELKAYAAEQAVQMAEEMVRQHIDDSGRQRLLTRFVEQLKNRPAPGSQN
jgi:F-type H+-transporting ATPase subunit b